MCVRVFVGFGLCVWCVCAVCVCVCALQKRCDAGGVVRVMRVLCLRVVCVSVVF